MVEYEMRNTKCPKCGSENLDRGSLLAGSAKVPLVSFGYVSDKQRFLSSPYSIRAEVCLECGYTELCVDAKKLKSKLKK